MSANEAQSKPNATHRLQAYLGAIGKCRQHEPYASAGQYQAQSQDWLHANGLSLHNKGLETAVFE